jgi:hypothetical protein
MPRSVCRCLFHIFRSFLISNPETEIQVKFFYLFIDWKLRCYRSVTIKVTRSLQNTHYALEIIMIFYSIIIIRDIFFSLICNTFIIISLPSAQSLMKCRYLLPIREFSYWMYIFLYLDCNTLRKRAISERIVLNIMFSSFFSRKATIITKNHCPSEINILSKYKHCTKLKVFIINEL